MNELVKARALGRSRKASVWRQGLTLVCAAVCGSVVPSAVSSLQPRLVHAQVVNQAPELDQVGIDEHLGAAIPKDLKFKDQTGREVQLRDYLDGTRPVVLNIGYHSCPTVCSMILSETVDALKQQSWSAGKEFTFLSLSIDPNDTPKTAAEKRTVSLKKYGRAVPAGTNSWEFLTGTPDAIRQVTSRVGFRYFYNKAQKQYAHPAVMVLLTPDGSIARYLYGLKFDPTDVQIGLIEAAKGHTVSTVEKFILYCYRYDPQGKKYVAAATRIMQLGGILTTLLVGGMLSFFWLLERRRRHTTRSGDGIPSPPPRKPVENTV